MIPQLVLSASNGLYFKNNSGAKRAAIDLKFCKENTTYLDQKLSICEKVRTNQEEQLGLKDQYIEGLQKDKIILSGVMEDYKKQYLNTFTDLQKEKESRPSRLTWFLTGFLTGIIAAGVIAFSAR